MLPQDLRAFLGEGLPYSQGCGRLIAVLPVLANQPMSAAAPRRVSRRPDNLIDFPKAHTDGIGRTDTVKQPGTYALNNLGRSVTGVSCWTCVEA